MKWLGLVLLATSCSSTLPYIAPKCVKSHVEQVPSHLVVYVYDLHTKFVGPQVSMYMAPETSEVQCDQWIGGIQP